MVGGTVLEVCDVPNRPDVLFVNVGDKPYTKLETCGVLVENNHNAREIQLGDSLWWQGEFCYWTPQDKSTHDVPIAKRSYSGVTYESVCRKEEA